MTVEDEIISQGRDAWSRLQAHERTSWNDWLLIGRALLIARRDCMLEARANSPLGWRYNQAMGKWLRENGLHEISGQDRYKILECLEHEHEIEQFRAGLDEAQRRRLNHPSAVLAHFRPNRQVEPRPRKTMSKTTTRRQEIVDGVAKLARRGKPIFWPQDHLRRAHEAMLASRSTDLLTLARLALQAAIRGEDDLLALIDDTPQRLPGDAGAAHQTAAL